MQQFDKKSDNRYSKPMCGAHQASCRSLYSYKNHHPQAPNIYRVECSACPHNENGYHAPSELNYNDEQTRKELSIDEYAQVTLGLTNLASLSAIPGTIKACKPQINYSVRVLGVLGGILYFADQEFPEMWPVAVSDSGITFESIHISWFTPNNEERASKLIKLQKEIQHVEKTIEILTASVDNNHKIKLLLMEHPVDVTEIGTLTIEDERIKKHVGELKIQLAELKPQLSRIQQNAEVVSSSEHIFHIPHTKFKQYLVPFRNGVVKIDKTFYAIDVVHEVTAKDRDTISD